MSRRNETARILLVDDDEQITDILALLLEREGYEVVSSMTGAGALSLLRAQEFALVLLDLRLGEENGLEILPSIRESAPGTAVFIITAHGDLDSAVEAFGAGANGYIRKPFEHGLLKLQIGQAIETWRMRQAGRVSGGPGSDQEVRGIIRSCDPAMDPVLRKVSLAAQVSSSVVVTGESGVGKELVARALHQCGPRREGPFVAINCAAIPETMLEAELFGYQRGAFTDARDNKPGLFVRANGGTIFLDEIGDAPLTIQAKLLRVLQEREVMPLGGTKPVRIDVRVVAATHRSLQEAVAAGRFRQDLYYRIHVVHIQVPALRERPRDIVLLGNLFAGRIAERLGVVFEDFTPGAIERMRVHPWHGNVRELQNRIEQALAIGRRGVIAARDLFPELEDGEDGGEGNPSRGMDGIGGLGGDDDSIQPFFEAKQNFERSYLQRVLNLARGNVAKAARLASKSRTEVYNLIRKHSIDPNEFKGDVKDERQRDS